MIFQKIRDWFIRHPHPQGLLFDIVFFIANGVIWNPIFQFAVPADKTGNPNPLFAWFLMAAVAAQALGAFLKRPALQTRLFPLSRPESADNGFFALMFIPLALHFILFFTVPALSAGALPFYFPVWALVFGAIPTVLTARALIPRKIPYAQEAQSEGKNWAGREAVGNLLLVFSAVVLQAYFQEAMVGGTGDLRHAHILIRLIVSGLLFIPFLLFYLPPRLLFLVEDGGRGRTWLRILLVQFPLTLHVLFPFNSVKTW